MWYPNNNRYLYKCDRRTQLYMIREPYYKAVQKVHLFVKFPQSVNYLDQKQGYLAVKSRRRLLGCYI